MSVAHILAAAFFYLASQIVRMLRISVLCLGDRKLLRRLILVHLLTLVPGALIPLKGGETLRLAGFVLVSPDKWSGGLVWIIERTLDALFLGVLLGLLALLGSSDPSVRLLILALLVFAFGVLTVGLAIRELTPFLHTDLLLRSRTERGLVALKIVLGARTVIAKTSEMLKGRGSLLVLLSSIIWILELLSVTLFLGGVGVLSDLGPTFSGVLIEGFNDGNLRILLLTSASALGLLTLAILTRLGTRGRRNA